MIKNILIGSIVLGFTLTVVTMFLQSLFQEQGFIPPASDQNKINYITNSTYSIMNDTQSFIFYAKNNIDDINANPQQTEGLDLVSIVGRVATSIIKVFVAIYELPLKYLQMFFVVLGLTDIANLVTGFIMTYFVATVIIVILSIFSRYPLDT